MKGMKSITQTCNTVPVEKQSFIIKVETCWIKVDLKPVYKANVNFSRYAESEYVDKKDLNHFPR